MSKRTDRSPRVYLVGSHASGKTTLARWIALAYGLPMISEVARLELAKREANFDDLRCDVDEVSTYQREVFAEQLRQEAAHRGGFVSDRAFDNLAYYAEHGDDVASVIESRELRGYVERVRRATVLFVRPQAKFVRGDGTRAAGDVDLAAVHRIDGMVKLMLEMWRVPYLPIESASMQERQRAVTRLLGEPPRKRQR